ncbi:MULTISPECIES: hypothetical protein [Pseudomonadaceae]|jgi:hypothetical protein|nr:MULTISPECIES: hypothetical protein [Pseudomonadaceae]MDH0424961.1 hypothetical protein [Stutzerimonas stutzeri]
MKRRRLLKVGMLNLLLLAGLPVARAHVARHVERGGWILRPEDD